MTSGNGRHEEPEEQSEELDPVTFERLAEESDTGAAPSSNGRRHGIVTASPEQLLIAQESQRGGYDFNLPREFLRASTEAEEYLPRAILTKAELKRIRRITARRNRIITGSSQPEHLQWLGLIATPAVDGRARRDALRAAGAIRDQLMDRVRGIRGVSQRTNGMENPSEVSR